MFKWLVISFINRTNSETIVLLFQGLTLVSPDDIDFPSTMTDIAFDTWMLR